tara:strand:+ start:575 stop:1012 length:438 start_codon:yes stop_codon:yes gene_type:complete
MNERKLNWYNCISLMDLQVQAQEFRHAYEVINDPERRNFQLTLINEEHRELLEAHLKVHDYEGAEADCLKELADLVYVCFQYAENLDWDLMEALHRVHKSNMSKLGDDGKPVRREDGKVLKGPNYKPPVLDDLTNTKLDLSRYDH